MSSSSSDRPRKRKHSFSQLCDYACCNRDASRMPDGTFVGRYERLVTTPGSPPAVPTAPEFKALRRSDPKFTPNSHLTFGPDEEVPTVTRAGFLRSFGVDEKSPDDAQLSCNPPSLVISSDDELDAEFDEVHADWLDHFEFTFGFRPPATPSKEQLAVIAPLFLDMLPTGSNEDKENLAHSGY